MRPVRAATGRAASIFAAISLLAGAARAADDRPKTEPRNEPSAEQIEAAVRADEQKSAKPDEPAAAPAPLDEAPPPPPHKKGIVLQSELGALGFFGQMRHLAPTAPWLHAQLGWEPLDWVMLFAEGDLAFTDTSVGQEASQARAFPIFGFGGGARVTFHIVERFAVWGQGALGAMKADIANRALSIVGYRDAESLGLTIGGRIGFDWYQLDRHLAFGAAFGLRDATGFAKVAAKSDSPLMWDAGLNFRYTF